MFRVVKKSDLENGVLTVLFIGNTRECLEFIRYNPDTEIMDIYNRLCCNAA